MCGHGVIAITTIAIERGLILPGPAAPTSAGSSEAGGEAATIVYDSPAERSAREPRSGQDGREKQDREAQLRASRS